MTDKERVKAIRSACDLLNREIRAAMESGLKVEINESEVRSVGCPDVLIVSARCYREVNGEEKDVA